MWLNLSSPPLLEVIVRHYASTYRSGYPIAYSAEIPLPDANIVKEAVTVKAITPNGWTHILRCSASKSIVLELDSTVITEEHGLQVGIPSGLAMTRTGIWTEGVYCQRQAPLGQGFFDQVQGFQSQSGKVKYFPSATSCELLNSTDVVLIENETNALRYIQVRDIYHSSIPLLLMKIKEFLNRHFEGLSQLF